VEPQWRRRFTLEELLAQCDPSAEPPKEDHEWLHAGPVADELL
jgi:antitoxin ChpS